MSPPLIQYAALPIRATGKHGIEVLLITSRRAQRWIIPKGWPKPGLTPHGTAAAEAFEEAGVVGIIGHRSIGTFSYEKCIARGAVAICNVDVFLLRVNKQLKEWPEQWQRRQVWCSPSRAARLVEQPELSALIRLLDKTELESRRRLPEAALLGLAE